MSTKKHFRVYVPKIIGGLILLAAIGYVIKIISDFIAEKPVKHEQKIQPVTLFKPPPPPPPPPPKVEEPPPEQEVEEKINEPEPEPEPLPDVPDEKPAGDTGLDAEGTAGSDAFGLVGRKGGRGLLGGGGSPYAWYAGTIKDSLLNILSGRDELRKKSYSAVVKIWLNPDGTVTRYELARGSNDPEIDNILNKLLAKFRKANEPPPEGMEQPIKLKISSRL